MPLDPTIANPSGLKLNDPLEQYNNYLLAATRRGEMRKAKREEEQMNALNAAFATPGAINPDGSYNLGVISNALAKSGIGSAIPGQYEQHLKHGKLSAETAKETALAGKANVEAKHEEFKIDKTKAETKGVEANTALTDTKVFDQAYANAVKALDRINPDPKIGGTELVNWVMNNFQDPNIGPTLRARGETPESQIAELKATQGDPEKFRQLLMRMAIGTKDATKQNVTTLDLGGHKQVISTNEHSLGAPEQNVLSDQKVTVDPNSSLKAPKVTVSVPVAIATSGGKKFSDTVMESRGKEYAALDTLNRTAPQEIASIDNTLRILNSGAVLTGAGSDVKLNLVRVAKSLGMRVDNATLVNTEVLRQQIASNLMSRLANLKERGVSLTPMSNLDIQELKATGPQATHDAETLKRMFLNYRETIQQGVARYEDMTRRMQNGEYTGETMEMYSPTPPAKVPSAPGQGGIPQGAIDMLRKNPKLAPQFDQKYGKGAAARVLSGRQ